MHMRRLGHVFRGSSFYLLNKAEAQRCLTLMSKRMNLFVTSYRIFCNVGQHYKGCKICHFMACHEGACMSWRLASFPYPCQSFLFCICVCQSIRTHYITIISYFKYLAFQSTLPLRPALVDLLLEAPG